VQQGDVVGVREVLGGRAGQLAEIDREDGGAQGVLQRLPRAEVGRDRQRAYDLGGADRRVRATR